VLARPVNADTAQRFRQLGVVGENRTAIAIAAEWFRREKAGRSRKAKSAKPLALVGRAKALSRVVENKNTLGLGNSRNGIVIGPLAEQIDRHNGLHFESELLRRRN